MARLGPAWFRWGLASRILGLVVLAALIAGGLVGVVVIERSRDALREEVLAANLATADVAAWMASLYVETARAATRDLATRPTIVSAVLEGAPDRTARELRLFLEANPRVDNASLYSTAGVGLVGGAPGSVTAGAVATDLEWYQQVMATGGPYLGVPVLSRGTGRPIVPNVVPIVDDRGVTRAIMSASISLAALSDAITAIRTGASSRASLMDLRRGGVILAHVDRTRILQPATGQNSAVTRLLAGERGTMETTSSAGEPVLAAFSPVPGVPWGVLILQPASEALAPVETLTRQALLLAAATALAAAVLAALLGLQITRPLLRLREAANAIAAGDLGARTNLSGGDEVGEVGRAFDHMAAGLAERTAQLEAAIKELEAFSYSVSHDLRAPLRSIDGFSQALLEDYENLLDDRGRDYLRRVRAASQRMGQLIDDMLKLSRATRDEMRLEVVDLSALALAVAADLQREDPTRQVEFAIAPDLAAPGDPRFLRVVLDNLLSNAWKFTGSRPRARIEFGATQGAREATYFVRDDGAGFDMAYVGKLFRAFERLHGAGQYPGTGIGLAIVQRIVQRHGGRVWAESAVGHGATFYFTLPDSRR